MPATTAGSLATLRPLQGELSRVLEPAGPLPPEVAASVIEATDRMVNSLDSIAAVLAERSRAVAGSADRKPSARAVVPQVYAC